MQNEAGIVDPDAFSQEFEPAKFSSFSNRIGRLSPIEAR